MFTGIVEELGTLAAVKRGANSAVLNINALLVTRDMKIGDSISVNGVCLTVTGFDAKSFRADVMHETLNRSSLAYVHTGARVNLERAMSASGRFGGHIVLGHVDGVGEIFDIRRDDNAVIYTIRADSSVLRYIVGKGSVAVDGISLTVAEVTDTYFIISMIPHTAAATALSDKKRGDRVNIETDVIGKYVERLLTKQSNAGITIDKLKEYGF